MFLYNGIKKVLLTAAGCFIAYKEALESKSITEQEQLDCT